MRKTCLFRGMTMTEKKKDKGDGDKEDPRKPESLPIHMVREGNLKDKKNMNTPPKDGEDEE